MKPITTEQLYEFYKDTIGHCGAYLLNEDDDVIEYNIFEEFDIDIITFLYPDNLAVLVENGFINREQMEKSISIREEALKMDKEGLWQLHLIKTHERWRKLMLLCDELRNTLK